MYPLIRFIREVSAAKRAPHLAPLASHVSTHRCWPWDLDPWMELNNGRTLTLYDLGRIPMAIRLGISDTLRARGWGFTVAGNSVRYRRRIKAFQRFTEVSRTIGWDQRFLYMEQSMWSKSECCNHMLLRVAIVGGGARTGIVPPAEFMDALGFHGASPELPGWVQAWIDADAQRRWPPELGDLAGARTDDLPALAPAGNVGP